MTWDRSYRAPQEIVTVAEIQFQSAPPSPLTQPSRHRTDTLNSFAPLISASTRVLVLGTMPGQASLDTVEYYAHPRNAFWPIAMAHILKTPPEYAGTTGRDYKDRCELLLTSQIGLWDVLAQCERQGSLDSNIIKQSEVPNAINELLAANKHINAIIFNGKTAEKLSKRHLKLVQTIKTHTLPSTSPAMASMTLAEKFTQWDAVLNLYR